MLPHVPVQISLLSKGPSTESTLEGFLLEKAEKWGSVSFIIINLGTTLNTLNKRRQKKTGNEKKMKIIIGQSEGGPRSGVYLGVCPLTLWWIFLTCRWRFDEIEKDLSQNRHLYGCSPEKENGKCSSFSLLDFWTNERSGDGWTDEPSLPVWVLRWRVRLAERGKILPQYRQLYLLEVRNKMNY